jgi:hypothetical protein
MGSIFLRLSGIVLLAFLMGNLAVGQTPDSWKGLIIDESTPERVLAILGNPKSDKPSDKWSLLRSQWFRKDIGQKLRTFIYENVEGFEKVRLKFDSGSRLVSIHLEPSEMSAVVFLSSYPTVEFRDDSEVRVLADLNRPRAPRARPDSTYWGTMFELVAATDKTVIIGAGYGGSLGKIKMIEMTSRSLEIKGSEFLK